DSVDFSEGQWTDKSDYSVQLHSSGILSEDTGSPNCDSIGESWSFEEGDIPRSWKATHSVSAKGKLVYDAAGNIPKLPWQIAKEFVTNKLGLGWTAVGDPNWSPLSGQDFAGVSAVQ